MITVTQTGSRYTFQGTELGEYIQGYSNQENWIYGAGGDDVLRVGRNTGLNQLFGEDGDDELIGGFGQDELDGGTGVDILRGGPGNDAYLIRNSGDMIVERERWEPIGTSGDLALIFVDYSIGGTAVENMLFSESAGDINGMGNWLNNFILANSGNNIIDGGLGIDRLEGREGDDIYILRHKQDVAIEKVGLTSNPASAGKEGHDTVWAYNSYQLMRGIEDIVIQEVVTKSGALKQGLTAIGNGHANGITGNDQDNNMNGRGGHDTLTGNGGADDFIFSQEFLANTVDTITDFATGEDRIVIKGALVDAAQGVLNADAFHLGADAQTAQHRFTFDGTTLRYDADGSGTGAAQDITNFDAAPTLTSDDVFVV